VQREQLALLDTLLALPRIQLPRLATPRLDAHHLELLADVLAQPAGAPR
jgi:hypothetical protein